MTTEANANNPFRLLPIQQNILQQVQEADRLRDELVRRYTNGNPFPTFGTEYPTDIHSHFRTNAHDYLERDRSQESNIPTRRTESMNLKDIMLAMDTIPEAAIALDLGVHAACEFDSNCPKAIRLRTLIQESGINMAQILQGYATVSSQSPPDRPINIDTLFPASNTNVDGHITVDIMGKRQTFDLSDEIRRQVISQLSSRLRTIQETQVSVGRIADSLYHAYSQAIDKARNSKVVPQLEFPAKELLANKIISNKRTEGGYNFYIPTTYKPLYLIDNGIRYKIADMDIGAIKRDNCFLKIQVNSSKTFQAVTLVTAEDVELNHYHGRAGQDCWGTMRLPERWDGTARQLQQITHERMGALVTVNYNSILTHEPINMPTDRQLRSRVIEMGREGELRPQADNEPPITFTMRPDGTIGAETPLVQVPVPLTQTRAGWGNRERR